MIDLKHALQDMGVQVVHIKTDSVKIPNASREVIEYIIDFGAKYGYEFEHETTYDKFCLVNDAVYIARDGDKWEAVGAQFQHPYVYKTLFSNEELTFDDFCELKSVLKGAIYIDFERDGSPAKDESEMHFIGRTGKFVPVIASVGGGKLYRVVDGKKYALAGTKGYLWMEAETVRELGVSLMSGLDMGYYNTLQDDAIGAINKFGSFKQFISD